MWQQSDKDTGTIMAGFQPGTYKLRDVNHDGKITSDSTVYFWEIQVQTSAGALPTPLPMVIGH